jgi:hypothetical protein
MGVVYMRDMLRSVVKRLYYRADIQKQTGQVPGHNYQAEKQLEVVLQCIYWIVLADESLDFVGEGRLVNGGAFVHHTDDNKYCGSKSCETKSGRGLGAYTWVSCHVIPKTSHAPE